MIRIILTFILLTAALTVSDSDEADLSELYEQYKSLFKMYDSDSDNYINQKELFKSFAEKQPENQQELQEGVGKFYDSFDENKDLQIDFDQFATMIATINKSNQNPESNQQAHTIFQQLDSDSDGFITIEQFTQNSKKYAPKEQSTKFQQEMIEFIKTIFVVYDLDDNGFSFEQYKQMGIDMNNGRKKIIEYQTKSGNEDLTLTKKIRKSQLIEQFKEKMELAESGKITDDEELQKLVNELTKIKQQIQAIDSSLIVPEEL